MVQRPNAVGLTLCQLVIVEEATENVTLANSFQTMDVDTFPAPGRYEFGLQANRELITQSVLEVREKASNDD